MSEMVERVAKALEGYPYVMEHPEQFREAARLVIEALREPTRPMYVAGGEAISNETGDLYVDATSCWAAMIDAALGSSAT